jgi:hypothetical protein
VGGSLGGLPTGALEFNRRRPSSPTGALEFNRRRPSSPTLGRSPTRALEFNRRRPSSPTGALEFNRRRPSSPTARKAGPRARGRLEPEGPPEPATRPGCAPRTRGPAPGHTPKVAPSLRSGTTRGEPDPSRAQPPADPPDEPPGRRPPTTPPGRRRYRAPPPAHRARTPPRRRTYSGGPEPFRRCVARSRAQTRPTGRSSTAAGSPEHVVHGLPGQPGRPDRLIFRHPLVDGLPDRFAQRRHRGVASTDRVTVTDT